MDGKAGLLRLSVRHCMLDLMTFLESFVCVLPRTKQERCGYPHEGSKVVHSVVADHLDPDPPERGHLCEIFVLFSEMAFAMDDSVRRKSDGSGSVVPHG